MILMNFIIILTSNAYKHELCNCIFSSIKITSGEFRIKY